MKTTGIRGLAFVASTLVVAGGCASVPVTLGTSASYACGYVQGLGFTGRICALQGQPGSPDDDRMSPGLHVVIASNDMNRLDLPSWEVIVIRDGGVMYHGRLRQTSGPPAMFANARADSRSSVLQPVPGRYWEPGHYTVDLVWTRDRHVHTQFVFVVPPDGLGPSSVGPARAGALVAAR